MTEALTSWRDIDVGPKEYHVQPGSGIPRNICLACPTAHQLRVNDFMRKAGQTVPETPIVPSDEVRLLRAKLIMEEAIETVNALGFIVDLGYAPLPMQGSVELRDCMTPDLIQVIDGCCDIKVVTTGTLSAFGVHDSPFQQEVDRTNLAKFGPGGHRRADGKWIKPHDWQPPRIQQILDLLYP